MMDQPDVRYCMTDDGVRLAYYVNGRRPAAPARGRVPVAPDRYVGRARCGRGHSYARPRAPGRHIRRARDGAFAARARFSRSRRELPISAASLGTLSCRPRHNRGGRRRDERSAVPSSRVGLTWEISTNPYSAPSRTNCARRAEMKSSGNTKSLSWCRPALATGFVSSNVAWKSAPVMIKYGKLPSLGLVPERSRGSAVSHKEAR